MANVNVPDPEKVRVLLTDPKSTPADIDRHGDAFLDAGFPSIAVMFYDRTKTADRAQRVLDLAIKEGDAFLLDWVARATPDRVAPGDWKRCADEALRRGKNSFARSAYLKGGDPEKASQVKD